MPEPSTFNAWAQQAEKSLSTLLGPHVLVPQPPPAGSAADAGDRARVLLALSRRLGFDPNRADPWKGCEDTLAATYEPHARELLSARLHQSVFLPLDAALHEAGGWVEVAPGDVVIRPASLPQDRLTVLHSPGRPQPLVCIAYSVLGEAHPLRLALAEDDGLLEQAATGAGLARWLPQRLVVLGAAVPTSSPPRLPAWVALDNAVAWTRRLESERMQPIREAEERDRLERERIERERLRLEAAEGKELVRLRQRIEELERERSGATARA